MTFKYVSWAFGQSVDAFHQCRPVICVDGTHLRGGYKGKMLIAVTKDANNYLYYRLLMPLSMKRLIKAGIGFWNNSGIMLRKIDAYVLFQTDIEE
ncbi:hypothetical protein Tco_0647162 [Tanacetum coccineum]